MPSRAHYFFRITVPAVFTTVLVSGITLFASPAYADPHAVFYTDRAQEQVFFNTLAALNQADYVEPGIPGVPYSRQSLVNQRAAALASPAVQFGPATNPLITSTRTDLPGIVSRNITLEGNDLWTAYLVNQFALETATRRSESELARLFCEQGLGRVRCDSTPGTTQQQEDAFTTNPNAPMGAVNVAIDSILSSGDQTETALRKEITAKTGDGLVYRIPRPNDASINALNKNVANNLPAKEILQIIQNDTTGSSSVDPDTFTGVTFSEDGVGHLAKDIPAHEYVRKLTQLSSLPAQYAQAAEEGRREALAFQNYVQNPTTKAKYVLERSPGSDGSGEVRGRITVPANVTDAAARLAPELPLLAAAQQKYTNPTSIQQSGNQSLVDPNLQYLGRLGETDTFRRRTDNDTLISSNGTPNGTVAGISTELDRRLQQLSEDTYTDPQGPDLSPGAEDQNILLEPGIFDTLRAITADDFRQGLVNNTGDSESSFGFKLDQILDSFTINDVLCSVFPSLESCPTTTENAS